MVITKKVDNNINFFEPMMGVKPTFTTSITVT